LVRRTVKRSDGPAAGLSTKIYLAVDRRGRPLTTLLTAGQAGDNPYLLPLLDTIRIHRPGPGRSRKRPDMLIADKSYAHDSTRAALRRRRIRHTIPERCDQLPAAPRRAAEAGDHQHSIRPRSGYPVRQTGLDLPRLPRPGAALIWLK